VNLSPVLVSYFLLMKTELTFSSASWDSISGARAICVYCGCVFNLRGQALHRQRGSVSLIKPQVLRREQEVI